MKINIKIIIILCISILLISCGHDKEIKVEEEIVISDDSLCELVSIEEIMLPDSVFDNPDTPYDDRVITLRDSDYKGMYVLRNFYLYSSPSFDDKKISIVFKGCAVNVVERKGKWCFVKKLFLQPKQTKDNERSQIGWIRTDNLGYYEDLDSNIGMHVLIKKESEPKNAPKEENGLWGEIFKEVDDKLILGLAGAWELEIDKQNVEAFFHKK